MATSWEDYILGEEPQWAYFASSPFTTSTQQGFAPAQQNYWRGQFSNIWNRYQGEVGQQAAMGEEYQPFTQYLDEMPFTKMYYENVSPLQRGAQRRYSPTTRFMYT